MAISGLITSQNLTATPATVNENDTPSGTFQATRLTVASTVACIAGGKVKIKQGVTTEEARIIRVQDSTNIIVEKITGTYDLTAVLTFLGFTNPGDALGTTVVRNATGLALHGSKNIAEVFWNNIALDLINVASYADTAITTLQNSVTTQIANLTTFVNDQIVAVTAYVNTQISDTRAWVIANAVPLGTVAFCFDATAPQYYMFLYGQTIGSAASSANLKGDTYKNIYFYFWVNLAQAQAPVTGGRLATAQLDWDANKPLQVPDGRGRCVVGVDNMGGTPAGRISAASFNGANGLLMGGTFGLETHTLTIPQIPAHTHQYNEAVDGIGVVAAWSGTAHNNLINTGSTGGGLAHSNTQPSIAINMKVKI